MAKTLTKYQSDTDDVHPILLDTLTAAAAGTAPAGDVNNNIRAKVSKTNRAYGLRPRGVRLSRVVGTAPNTFKRYKFLPVLTAAAFATPAFNIGATITINTVAWTVTEKKPEDT